MSKFVFMNTRTLNDLRSAGMATNVREVCAAREQPPYARWDGKRVITSAAFEDGVISERITRAQHDEIRARFSACRWPMPDLGEHVA